MPLAIQTIVESTPKEVVKRTPKCRRKLLGTYTNNGFPVFVFATGCEVGKLDYYTQVGVLKPIKGFTSPCVIHCTCPMFTYTLEYACAKQGASFFYNALRRYPKIRNPKAKCYLCKHLITVLRTVKQKLAKYQDEQ